MCGCEMCIHIKKLQTTLNSWSARHSRNNRHYKTVLFPDDKSLHSNSRDAVDKMICVRSCDSILPK